MRYKWKYCHLYICTNSGTLTADPGFIGVQPGSGVITCPPVSVCQNVSAIEHFSLPICL